MADREKAGPEKGIVERRPEVEYLPAGVRVDPYEGNEPLLDPELEKLRDQEAKALSEVKVEGRSEPTIDPDLVKARDGAIQRDAKRAKEAGLPTRAKASGNDNVAKESSTDDSVVTKKSSK